MYPNRTLQTKTFEWHVPVNGPWGATWTDIGKTIAAAEAHYRKTAEVLPDQSVPDSVIRIFPGDENLIVRYSIDVT